MERYEARDCIFSSPENDVFLHHALDRYTNSPVILKFIKASNVYEMNIIRKEIDNHIRVNAHPYICKIYDSFQIPDLANSPQGSFLVLVLEQCISDLDKLRTSNSSPKQYFEESYLWKLLHKCVEALAYAQDFVRTK